MSIRNKVFLIIFFLFTIMAGVNFLIQRFFIYPSFLQLDFDEAGENLKRIFHALDREVSFLDELCGDWAVWDDSFAFLEQPSAEFIASNLNETTIKSTNLNLLVYCKLDGAIVWQQTGDWAQGKALSFDFIRAGKIAADHPLLDIHKRDGVGKGAYGIFRSQFGPMVFSTRQVLHSDGSGPSNGFLILGRFLGEEMVEALRQQTRIHFEIIQPSSPVAPMCAADKSEFIKDGDLSFYALQDKTHIRVCAVYQDMAGQPLFGIKYPFPKKATRKGIASMGYASAMLMVSGLAILFIFGVVLQRTILKPLHQLTRHAARLAQEGDYTVRLEFDRRDEIGSLAQSFDSMVEKINQRQSELKDANERLTRMSMLDGLTGVANRRMFDLTLNEEWRRAVRSQEPLSLILLDVDFFKQYNDTYGHHHGDMCLVAVATALQGQIHRTSDLVARYGGEEFAIVLPGTPGENAFVLAQKACTAVQALQIEHNSSAASPFVSISLGVATIVPGKDLENAGIKALLEKADLALYQAKLQGRNRAVFSSQS